MIRGILSGGLWGILVSAVVLTVASLVGEQPSGSRPPQSPVVEAPALAPGLVPGSGAIGTATKPALPGGMTDPGGAPQPSQAPGVGAPAAATALPEADTALPVSPQAEGSLPDIAQPSDPTGAPDVAFGSDAPVQAGTAGQALTAPQTEAGVEVVTEPISVAPPSDAPTAPAAVAQDTAPDVPEVTSVPMTSSGAPVAELTLPDPTLDSQGSDTQVAQDPSDQPQVDTIPAGQPSVGEIGAAPSISDTPETGAFGTDVPAMTAPQIDLALPLTPAPTPEASAEPRITLQGDAATLPGGGSTVRIIRPGRDATQTPGADIAMAEVDEIPEQAPAYIRFAAPYENPEGKPLLSVILIDNGQLGDAAVPAVASIPFPVTVGLDANAPGASGLMAAYRAAGVEVIALSALPQGAQPTDVEVTLEAAFAAVPEAIGLLDDGAGGLQSDRAATDQVMARLVAEGRGLVTQTQGLNMALRAAEAAGVPAGEVYRDLDADGQDARVIRRFLDQAAFRARQQSGVVLLGRVRPDTLSALILWGTANRAADITLAPVSAVFKGD